MEVRALTTIYIGALALSAVLVGALGVAHVAGDAPCVDVANVGRAGGGSRTVPVQDLGSG